jgi:hypothetical protein
MSTVRKLRWAALIAVAAAAAWMALYPVDWQNWLGFSRNAYFTTGQNYAFFSGFGAWLSSTLGLSAIAVTLWRHLNCHADGCLRIGRYPVAGGAYKVCRRHHEHVTGRPHKLTADALRAAHIMHTELLHAGHIRGTGPPP